VAVGCAVEDLEAEVDGHALDGLICTNEEEQGSKGASNRFRTRAGFGTVSEIGRDFVTVD
jgi:hypothetical protein